MYASSAGVRRPLARRRRRRPLRASSPTPRLGRTAPTAWVWSWRGGGRRRASVGAGAAAGAASLTAARAPDALILVGLDLADSGFEAAQPVAVLLGLAEHVRHLPLERVQPLIEASSPTTELQPDHRRSPRCPRAGPSGRTAAAPRSPAARGGRSAVRGSPAGAGPALPTAAAQPAAPAARAVIGRECSLVLPHLRFALDCARRRLAAMNPIVRCWWVPELAPPSAAGRGRCRSRTARSRPWRARRGAGGAGAEAGGGATACCGPRIRSAPLRLTFEAIFPGGPTGGATAEPTLIRSASGLPALSSGAVAVSGTVIGLPRLEHALEQARCPGR